MRVIWTAVEESDIRIESMFATPSKTCGYKDNLTSESLNEETDESWKSVKILI